MGGVVDRHAADALLVESNPRVADLQRALIERSAAIVEYGLTFVLPRILGSTATSAEHEAARAEDVSVLDLTLHLLIHLVVHLVEVVVRIDVGQTYRILQRRIGSHTIDIDIQPAHRVAGDGETLRPVICFCTRSGANRSVYAYGVNLELF